jgi:hypothetical protein
MKGKGSATLEALGLILYCTVCDQLAQIPDFLAYFSLLLAARVVASGSHGYAQIPDCFVLFVS